MTEGSPAPREQQATWRFTAADLLTVIRLPLAVAFVLIGNPVWRAVIVAVASLSDLLDGLLARHVGGSRLGLVLDPVADKLFMAAAFGVVAFSGALAWYEIVGVLLRDIVATVMFVRTLAANRPTAIPARWSGKAVTAAQVLTLFAFLGEWPILRPLAWLTTLVAAYSIWDYYRAAPVAGRRL